MADTTGDGRGDDEAGAAQSPDGPMLTVAVEAIPSDLEPIAAERPPAPTAARRAPRWWRSVGVVVLSAAVGAAGASAVLLATDDDPAPTVTAVTTVPVATTAAVPGTAADVAARVIPSIVTVEVATVAAEEFVPDATGSGVVVSGDGTIVTNEHVVEGAVAIRVVFPDGRTYQANLVGADALSDLAVISIEATGLSPVAIGSSRSLAVGDPAIAIGSPLGLEGGPSVTVGVVSAFDRTLRTSEDSQLFGLIQTDAPITRGSSGGALVDTAGRLIGITTAIGVSDVGAEGLGFAIPVEMVQRVTEDLIALGRSPSPFLGISGSTFFESRPDGAMAPAGVAVAEVIAGTAAEEAGLAAGDTIVSFDGDPVTTMDRLVVSLRYYRVGDTITLGVRRDGADLAIEVTLRERPADL